MPDDFQPMTTFLARLRELLKGKVDSETYRAVENMARGYAGGKAKAQVARQITATIRSHAEELELPLPEYEAAEREFYESVLDYTNDVEPGFAQNARLPKADERVNFRKANEVGQTCGDCKFYTYGSCRMVEGSIERTDTCDLFSERGIALAEGKLSGRWLFLETPQAYAEAPDWMPLLPKVGSHKHPRYGTVAFTKERNAGFVKNFKNKVYQEQLPVDAEHQLKLSGAVGWIKELRQNTDGSVDAKVDWTDRGKSLIKAGGYRYVSPEFLESFVQPESGKTYEDVVIGAAITTRPFFKERSLRPLVASEQGFSIADSDEILESADEEVKGMPDKTEENTDDTDRKFAEMQAENAELKAFREEATKIQTEQSEKISKLETDARTKRFTDEVMGRSSESDIRWHGEVEKHVKTLAGLATAFGEDAEEFKDYVTQQREYATKVQSSGMFTEAGSEAGGGSIGTAYAEIQAKAKKLVEEGKSPTIEQAFAEVAEREPELVARHYNEGGN